MLSHLTYRATTMLVSRIGFRTHMAWEDYVHAMLSEDPLHFQRLKQEGGDSAVFDDFIAWLTPRSAQPIQIVG